MAASAADAGERSSAAARLRLAWRVVRAAELLALAFLASRSFPRLPYAAAAASSALRVAASLLLHPRSVFLIANAIVLLLFLFSRRDPSSAPSSSDQDHFLSFAGPQLLLPSAADSPAPASGPDAVFEDKQAVHVTTVRAAAAAAPRRSRSEKIGCGKPGGARSPDMRRSESDNGRRRSTSSSMPEEWGGAEDDDDEEGEEFRRAVEAFIAKQQTRFHREESFGLVTAGDDAQAITAVAAAVSPVK